MHQEKYMESRITKNGWKTGENDVNQVWSGWVAGVDQMEPDQNLDQASSVKKAEPKQCIGSNAGEEEGR